MKALKIFTVAAMAIMLAAPCHANVSSEAAPAAQTASTSLTKNNGAAAGKALLALYTQYKSNGSLDMTNAMNIANMITLANNIKGLKSNVNTANFVKGLISGSGKLVNTGNSKNVLGSLTKLAGLDLSSLQTSAKAAAKTAATNAAKSAATDALSKIASSKDASTAVSNAKEIASAASTLNSLFKTLKK